MGAQGKSSPEDLLSDMFKSFGSFGGAENMNKMLITLVRNVQINMLRQLRQELDKSIRKLTQEGVADMAYDESLDPYKILGVEQTATRDDIDKAYKKRAREVHPDRGGSTEDMIKVNAAYESIKQFRGWK